MGASLPAAMTTSYSWEIARAEALVEGSAMLRSFFIALSESKSIRSIAENSSVGQKVSKRFVAGMTVEDLIVATEAMNRIGVHVTVDNLGENVTNREEALHSKALYHQLFNEIDKRKLDANVSLKLTHMGLDVDEALARCTVAELLEHAIAINSFIRVDMEGSHYTQKTLDFVRELHRRPNASGHIGTVLQSYFYRTEEDARQLCAEGIRIRLCKGAYKEPPSLAYPDKHDVDANYIKVAKQILKSGRACPRARSSSRCCTGCAAICRKNSPGMDGACAATFRLAPSGTRTLCAGSPSVPRMSYSWRKIISRASQRRTVCDVI
jgi:proline dehydrogenase